MNSLELARRIVELADDRKAKDPVILGLKELTIVADYFVVLTGTSRTQVLGIANHIEEELASSGLFPTQRESDQEAKWLLLDYGDVVVHVFQEDARMFYNLERLWNDAQRIPVNESSL